MTDPISVPCRELRLGIVLYGGVSLAIYMAGITEELHALLRASRDRASGGTPPADAPDPAPTSAIYRDLLDELAKKTVDLRVVVDTIAGSSAGGLNGAVLARAIATGGGVRHMNGFWIDKADITNLKDDPEERAGWLYRMLGRVLLNRFASNLPPQISQGWLIDQVAAFAKGGDGTRTPLDGRKFIRLIGEALNGIGRSPAHLLPDGQRLDLFLTRSDLHGWPRFLPIDGRLHWGRQQERRFPHAMRFETRGGLTGDFDDIFALTYACRSTAGFPIAFAPLRSSDVAEELSAHDGLADFHSRHLGEHLLAGDNRMTGDDWGSRAQMADGGLHDNKPFGPVIDAIGDKPARRQVIRLIAYVEPTPEREVPIPDEVRFAGGALIGRLYHHFRYEPILDDLEAVAERNRVAQELKLLEDETLLAAQAFRSAFPHTPAHSFAPASVAPYERACRRSAAAMLADLINGTLSLPRPSRQAHLIRRIARLYVEADPQAAAAAATFPRQDRRRRFLVRRANQLYVSAADRGAVDAFKSALTDLAEIRPELDRASTCISFDPTSMDDMLADPPTGPGHAAFAALTKAVTPTLRCALAAVTIAANRLTVALDAAVAQVTAGPVATALRGADGLFDLVDLVIAPEMIRHRIEEPQEARIVRISPVDCRSTHRVIDRAMGDDFGAFAGFLSRDARVHDILLGRLNSAERLLDMILDTTGLDRDCAGLLKTHYRTRLFNAITDDLIRIVDETGGLGERTTRLLQRLELLAR
jgi:patatin-related protein